MRTLGELMWPSKKENKKPNRSTEKKENANCFGEKTGRINPTSSGDCSIISASSPDFRYVLLSPLLHLFIPSIFNLSLSSSLHPFLPSPSISGRKLFCALPLFYLSISLEPFISLSHLSTRKLPLLLLLQLSTRKLKLPLLLLLQLSTRKLPCSFCFLLFFYLIQRGEAWTCPCPLLLIFIN